MSEAPAKPFVTRQRAEIGVACLLVVAFLFGGPALLSSVCSKSEMGNEPIAYDVSIHGQSNEPQPGTQHQGSIKTAATSATSEITANGRAQPASDPGKKQHEWRQRFWCDVNASDFAIALFTLVLAIVTYFLWRETERLAKGGDEQAGKMAESIKEAARAATAMEGVAASMASNVESVKESVATSKQIADRQKLVSEMQLRAYLNVVIGGGIYQDRENGLRFEARPLLVNTGPTPASKVAHVTNAGIFPVPLPNGFEFPVMGTESAGENMIGPQQNRSLSGMVADFVPDDSVEDIKRANGRGLYVWGAIKYVDAFNEPRETKFCQLITWLPDGRIWGYYIPNRNSAT